MCVFLWIPFEFGASPCLWFDNMKSCPHVCAGACAHAMSKGGISEYLGGGSEGAIRMRAGHRRCIRCCQCIPPSILLSKNAKLSNILDAKV